MQRFKLKLALCLSILSIGTGCTMLQHGDDPNYTYCKTLENKILFHNNSTTFSTNPVSTYSQTAALEDSEDVERSQMSYDRLNCARYEAIKF